MYHKLFEEIGKSIEEKLHLEGCHYGKIAFYASILNSFLLIFIILKQGI